MSFRTSQSSPGVSLARLLLASALIVTGGWRLWGAYQGAPASGATLSFSVAALVLGVLVAAAWRLRATAMLAAALVVAEAAMSHPFWAMGGGVRGTHLLQFMKDAGLAGGFLLLALTSTAARRR
ncbi:hypothetical protein [uncultured Luteimonas sp.]|uniref:hypothetical protein n=1 Tax=uncultured Luteimonas sp. TaxID=453144 RepID=UPI00263049A8|nr:hypothetical protein [uncultured Luteimonas sp.]